MNLKLIDKYVELCRLYNNPVTWTGLAHFKKAFRQVA